MGARSAPREKLSWFFLCTGGGGRHRRLRLGEAAGRPGRRAAARRVAPRVALRRAGSRILWGVGGQAARRGVAGRGVRLFFTFPPERSKVPRDFRLPRRDANRRARAPGAQMIHVGSGSGLCPQRVSRDSFYRVYGNKIPPNIRITGDSKK
eukprot:gene24588-biopygen7406